MNPICFSIKDAIAASGGAISRSTLYRAAAAGELPIRKLGRRSFILADDLKHFLESRPVANPIP
jgi:excisionase family DNA binding protein